MDNQHTYSLSALSNHFQPGHFGVSSQVGVTATEVVGFNLLQIAAWPQSLTHVAAITGEALAVNAPGPGQSVQSDTGVILRVEPLKWWLVTSQQHSLTDLELDSAQSTRLDLSHSRTWLKLKGDKTASLLNHFLPIDFRTGVFQNGSVISTALHHIGITLYYHQNEFNLFLPRSFALSLWELLYESSLQYGLEVKPATPFV